MTRTGRAPHRMRDSRSRPSGSVPSQCAFEGVVLASAVMSLAFGGYGAISGATSASPTQDSTMTMPTVAGADSPSAESRRRHRRARTRDAAGDDADSVPAATGVLMA